MIDYPEKIKKVVNDISKIPGIGKKSALRQVLNIVKWDIENIEAFSKSISGLKNINYCKRCNIFCDDNFCNICVNPLRSDKIICVVENMNDLIAIENSGNYLGKYFVLGGVLNPLSGIGANEIHIDKLLILLNEFQVEEIILAINPSVEGDATCSYIKQKISSDIKIERIGFGIPIGGNLEYLDPLTISKALENKRIF